MSRPARRKVKSSAGSPQEEEEPERDRAGADGLRHSCVVPVSLRGGSPEFGQEDSARRGVVRGVDVQVTEGDPTTGCSETGNEGDC